MPKMSDREMGGFFDPESEEFSPTKNNIDDDERAGEAIGQELHYIQEVLSRPRQDLYSNEESKFNGIDPEYLWDRLMHLDGDLKKIRDKELKNQLKAEILAMDQKIYKQFIPFIESRINSFGYQNSPLEEKFERAHTIDSEDIYEDLMRALRELDHFKFPEEKNIDYLNELDALKDKFERYRSEATLFTFEDKEEKLYKDLSRYFAFDGFVGHDIVEEKMEVEFGLWLAQVHNLVEIADRMLHIEIKSECMVRAKALLSRLEYLKAEQKSKKENTNKGGGHFKMDTNQSDWAWAVLGISKTASREDLKKAHHRLVLQYHSDSSVSQDSVEGGKQDKIMQQINAAADFIKRVNGWKTAD